MECLEKKSDDEISHCTSVAYHLEEQSSTMKKNKYIATVGCLMRITILI